MKTSHAFYRFLKKYGIVWLFVPMIAATLLTTLVNQARATAVPTRTAYWQLDETAGPPYLDTVGNHDGQCAGSCPTADSVGQINGGQAFDGISNGIAIIPATAFNWDANASFSIELWVKATPGQTCATTDQTMVGRADSGASAGFWSLGCAATTGVAQFQLGDAAGFSATLESTKVITTGEWHHIAAGRDGTNNANYLYVDGAAVISATHSYSGEFAPYTADISLGYLENGSYFKGILDEVAIYDGALSAAEIQSHYYLSRNYADSCAAPVNIMPLGDSITKGSRTNPITGYRQSLFLSLTDQLYFFDFLGTAHDGDTAVPPFDTDHEGHSGWHAYDPVFDNILNDVFNWLTINPPDVILLAIGTNDILDGQDAASLVPEISLILDEIDRFDENITVILAQITNLNPTNPSSATVSAYNDGLVPLVDARIAAGDKLILVNMEDALTYPDDLAIDGIHPRLSGYEKMADVWLAELNKFMPACLAAPQISSTPITETLVDQPYSYDVEATGIQAPTYTLTLNPTAMTIDVYSGVINWVPAATGIYSVSVDAANTLGLDTQNFSITVMEEPAITSTPVTEVGIGSAYEYTVQASGYPTPTYALTAAPGGMSIIPDTGSISWTPMISGSFNITVTASNAAGVDTQNFAIMVTETPAIYSPPITETSLGQSYSYDVNATGYPTPTYALRQAPAGMDISAETGLIGWTPGSSGVFSVTVEAQNIATIAAQGFTITVTEAPAILSTPLTTIELGQVYGHTVQASGFPTPTFSLTNMPVGMTIGVDSGVIAWTPTASGVYNVGVQASNVVTAALQTFAITVTQAPAFVSTPITEVGLGEAYAYDVNASGFPDPTYSLPTAPSGMNINADSGVISWSPTITGTFSVVVKASNNSADVTQSFDVMVTEAAAILSTAVTEIGAGDLYNYDVQAAGYPTPTYALTVSPAGMTIDPDSGLIVWTSSVGGEYDVTVTASNSVNTAVQSFVLIVTETAVITSSPITQTSVGQLYNYDVDATGYPTPTYALTTAPAGMSINANSGLIEWTPSTGGAYSVTVTANNAVGSQNQAFNLMATQTPAIASTPVIEIGINQSYSYEVTATGYPAPTFTLTTAPTGMSINATTGIVSWTPTMSGLFDVTLTAVNTVGSAAQNFPLAVTQAPTITSTPLLEVNVGHSYSYAVTTDGYPAPTFTLTTAPAGMTIDRNSGLIKWTPDMGGTFTVTVSANNSVDTAVQTFDITVNEYLIYLPIVLRSGP